MNPAITNQSEDGYVYSFTLSDVNVSIANALRRIMLSEIPTYAFITDTYDNNKCNIEINTSRLHNEIIKQRLGCIPIHETDLDILTDKYVLEVDVKNETDNVMYVTTEHFRIRNKATGNLLTEQETHRIFPANRITSQYIDFVRLKPRISDSIPGEQIKLTAEFSVSMAKVNSMYNVVSKCAYGNTPDLTKITEAWEERLAKLVSDGMTEDEIRFNKSNFNTLDAQRIFKPDSFDFVVQTIGVYDNRSIIKKGCAVLQNKFVAMIEAINSDIVPIERSETSIDHCYDITLEDEDYTIGKVLEYALYNLYFEGEHTLSFCGFKKFHPHLPNSTIRVAFTQEPGNDGHRICKDMLIDACTHAQEVYSKIFEMF
uniref:DNA-directed RNA polymerase RpoA/D/Rpb3-type domain-containing protein n=1 Tax=viral metagenome TaxID=1070528 RepID=A0A6C0HI11_9ZZZZ